MLHPGSGSPRKNWPADRWRALLDHLLRATPASTPLVVILGEAESTAWENPFPTLPDSPAPCRAPGSSRLVVLRQRPLEELVAVLAGARLFLGHDSGISHLAAACGAPCVLLFGPTAPAIWAPPGEHVRVIAAGPDLAALPLERVLAALPPLA
jgi:heptosyltransferase-2